MSETAPVNVFLLTFARRGEEPAIRAALDELRERYPEARLRAIGTPTSEAVLRELGLERVLIYTRGESARRVLEEAQLCMPEATAIVYGGDDFRGHLKLELLAYAIGAPVVLRCRAGRPPVEMNAWHLAGLLAWKGAQAFARVAVGSLVATARLPLALPTRRRRLACASGLTPGRSPVPLARESSCTSSICCARALSARDRAGNHRLYEPPDHRPRIGATRVFRTGTNFGGAGAVGLAEDGAAAAAAAQTA